MVAVKADKNDTNDKLVKKFLRKVKKAGIIEEVFSRQHYVKPSIKRKEAKRRRNQVLRQLQRERDEDAAT